VYQNKFGLRELGKKEIKHYIFVEKVSSLGSSSY